MDVPSLALGLAPLCAPRTIARAVGFEESDRALLVVRLLGLRELLVALAFLRRRSPRWLWGFVAQDAMDLPVFCYVLTRRRLPDPDRFRRALLVYLGLAVVDVTMTRTHHRGRLRASTDVGWVR